jgi:hypothetical protein
VLGSTVSIGVGTGAGRLRNIGYIHRAVVTVVR